MSTTTKKTTAPKRSTAARRRTTAKSRPAATATSPPKSPAEQAQELAQRAVLVPVGAALTAFDRARGAVTEFDPPSRDEVAKRLQAGQKRVGTDIKRFERRGTTASKRVNRQVKKTRTRLQRELRRRRSTVERSVRRNRTRIEREVSAVRRDPSAAVESLSTRVESAVGSGMIVGQRIVTTAQERVARAA